MHTTHDTQLSDFPSRHAGIVRRAHITPDPEAPGEPPAPPPPPPVPDDVPDPVNAPVEEPRLPEPPIRAGLRA